MLYDLEGNNLAVECQTVTNELLPNITQKIPHKMLVDLNLIAEIESDLQVINQQQLDNLNKNISYGSNLL